MRSKNYGSRGCGCGGGAASKGIAAVDTMARTGYHARARSAGQAAPNGGSGDCGCGGSCGGDCGCGSAGDSCGCNPGVLVQPSFFAGQLLTDDDLQALTNFVLTKQRMHNRFLVGSGVACGLAVTCHPCGGGRVIVQPGYAVDCCGNEILVPCAVELDINAMVRALRISMQGQDCGDPCAEPVKDRSQQSRAVPAAAGQPGTQAVPGDEQVKARGRRYCLYIDYCEEPGELVAPYSQDDSCAVTCQPSRIREGFSFELRCPADDPTPPSFVDRLECCLGDLREADGKATRIERSQAYAQRNALGLAAWKLGVPPLFDEADAALIMGARPKLEKITADFTKTGVGATDNAGGAGVSREQMLRTALDEVHAVGAATARFKLLSIEERRPVLDSHPDLGAAIKGNRPAIDGVANAFDGQVAPLLASPFEQTVAHAVFSETLVYTKADPEEVLPRSPQSFAYAYNSVSTPAANNEAHEAMADFKAWLLRKIDECPPTGECCLEAEIAAIQVPTGEQTTEETLRAADKLVRALIRYLLDCICAALLPPCPTCEDPAVKLACVRIDDCNVCEICNLERTFLLTEHNLRYWIPLLHSFGEALERLCCDFAGRFQVRGRTPVGVATELPPRHLALKKQTGFFASGGQFGDLAASHELFPNILRLTGLDAADVRSSLNIGSKVARAAARDPVMTSLLARYTDADFARLGRGDVFATALVPGPSPEMAAAQAEHATGAVLERVGAQIREVAGEMLDKRLSPKALGQAKVIMDLKEQLNAQREANEKLAARLDALEKRKSP